MNVIVDYGLAFATVLRSTRVAAVAFANHREVGSMTVPFDQFPAWLASLDATLIAWVAHFYPMELRPTLALGRWVEVTGVTRYARALSNADVIYIDTMAETGRLSRIHAMALRAGAWAIDKRDNVYSNPSGRFQRYERS